MVVIWEVFWQGLEILIFDFVLELEVGWRSQLEGVVFEAGGEDIIDVDVLKFFQL